MKRVLLYSEGLVDDRRWAKQFVDHDPSTRQRIDTGSAPDWAAMITKVETAAKAAAADGVIFFLGGHSVPSDENNPNSGWISVANGGKVKINAALANYDVKGFPVANQPSQKASDDSMIADAAKVSTPEGKKEYLANTYFGDDKKTLVAKQNRAIQDLKDGGTAAEARRKRFENYLKMGAAIKGNKVARVVFLSCRIAQDTALLKKIAKDWGTEVVAYKQFITLQEVDGKVLLFLSPTHAGKGTQRQQHDQIFIPDIDANTAFTATP